MTGNITKTEDVFGVSNKQIESYIERQEVDDKFVAGLKTHKHIIIYGASKQGKTALTNKHLEEDEYIRVDCSPNSNPIDLYKSVLRQLGVEFQETRVVEESSGINPNVGIKASVKIPFIGEIGGSTGVSITNTEREVVTYKSIEFNLELAQDISEILKAYKFTKRIILENFHYLEEDVQKQMAFDLRVFEDHNILFIILGIWREKNRLSQFNGDLLDRMIEIPVEPWKNEDFKRVLREGEPLLNVDFREIENNLIEATFDSIGVFQELCKHSCNFAGVDETVLAEMQVITSANLQNAISLKLEDYASRHIRSLETFIEQKAKSSDEVPLYLGYYFVKALFENDFKEITKGFKRREIHEMLKTGHHRPDDVRPSDLSYFLHNLVANQIKKKIIPPIFDYDRSTRVLRIIDSTFYFFLQNVDKGEILEELDVPEIK